MPSQPSQESEIRPRPSAAARLRVPEPMVMDEPEAAAAFHRAGEGEGPLIAQYELCARGMSSLLPRDGVVLDLGSGSGRCLAYFAERRPDAQILGLELSEPMLELGGELLAAAGLGERVKLMHGDMTDFLELVPERLDLLSCVLALHQLPSAVEVMLTLRQIAAIRERTGCAVWIWDLARLKDGAVMQEWLSQASDLDPLFLRDALASEAAAWTLAELTDALEDAPLGNLHHGAYRPPLLQAHWARHRGAAEAAGDEVWQELPMPEATRNRVAALRAGFRTLPG